MAKNSYKDLTAFFTPPKYADQKNVKEKNIPWWLFEGITSQGKYKMPDGLDWPCYLDGGLKSHHGVSNFHFDLLVA